MAVTINKADLEFILEQIKIAEAHAAGAPLFGPGGLVPAYNVSAGLRTVDGTYNHLLPGQETWGAADQQFPALMDPAYRDGHAVRFRMVRAPCRRRQLPIHRTIPARSLSTRACAPFPT